MMTQPEIPVSLKRAPVEIERERRMGRKCWNSALSGVNVGINRPETPLYAEWSPIEASLLMDRLVPSYPKAIRTMQHKNKSPRPTKRMDSEKQQLIHCHYAEPHPPQDGSRKNEKTIIKNAERKGRTLMVPTDAAVMSLKL